MMGAIYNVLRLINFRLDRPLLMDRAATVFQMVIGPPSSQQFLSTNARNFFVWWFLPFHDSRPIQYDLWVIKL